MGGGVVIIIDPKKSQDIPAGEESGEESRVIKVKLEGDGPLSDLLREAADVIDGTPQE